MRNPPAWTLAILRNVDAVSRVTGLAAIWLTLICALLSAINAGLRYSSGTLLWLSQQTGIDLFRAIYAFYAASSNAFGDAVWYMFAATVMLGGAWTLKVNGHVRVDLLYGAISERARTWIDLLGGVFFLLPLSALLIYFTWGWAWDSAIHGEASASAGGLPQWPAKMLLPGGFALLGLQGLAEIVKCVLALTTTYVREYAYEKPVQ